MHDELTRDDQRAHAASRSALAIQLLLYVGAMVLVFSTGAQVMWALCLQLKAGIFIFFVLTIYYRQRRRVDAERLESEEIRRAKSESGDAGIFEVDSEDLLLQQRRLTWMEKWFLPSASIFLIIFHIQWLVIMYFRSPMPIHSTDWTLLPDPLLFMFVMGFGTFTYFLLSRYMAGMSKKPAWKLLRAGASYLTGIVITLLGMTAALCCRHFDIQGGEAVASWGVHIFLFILGLEFALNFILNFYRPRRSGEIVKVAFDSRLLGLITEPGGIAKSIADAVNYQFGFEVSKTWFYVLLKRSVLPLIAFTVVALISLSTVVIVDADEQAVIERFGKVKQQDGEVLSSGLHWKMPWPIDRVRRARVNRVHRMLIGGQGLVSQAEYSEDHAVLWAEKHEFVPETMLLVANPPDEFDGHSIQIDLGPDSEEPTTSTIGSKSASVGLLMMSMPVQFRIKNLHDYLYNYANTEELLVSIASRVLSDYAASVELDEIMARTRKAANGQLWNRIQKEIDELQMGIEITFLALQNVHPPQEDNVAEAFQKVVEAENMKEAFIVRADGLRRVELIRAAGSLERAYALDESILEANKRKANPESTPEEIRAAEERVEALLLGDADAGIQGVGGEAAALITKARADATKSISAGESQASRFAYEVEAFQAAPEVYKARKIIEVLARNWPNVPKWVLTSPTLVKKLVTIMTTEETNPLDLSDPMSGH
jgi:regulator of protease activity HflC (stomatin/prohibitin superfamily)